MDAQAHLNFLKNMRSQLDAQIAECEQAVKAQFDAAQIPMPIADEGWVEWKGGECPVDPETIVEARDGAGVILIGPAHEEQWTHDGNELDIIAYRIAGERT